MTEFQAGETAPMSRDATAETPAVGAPETGRHPWRGRDIAFFGAAFIVLNVAVVVAVPWLPFRGDNAPAFRALTGTLIVELSLLALVYLVIRFVYGLSFVEEMRWSRDYRVRNGTLLLYGMGLAVAVMVVSSIFPPSNTPIEQLLSTREAVLVFAVFGIVFAPFLEELLFRGFLFRVLEEIAGANNAVRATTLLFGLMHVPQLRGSWAGMLVIFAVGYTLSTLRRKTNSILPPIIVHTAYNGTLFFAFGLSELVQGAM